MYLVAQIEALAIALEVDGQATLELALTRDGEISRCGNGVPDAQEHSTVTGTGSAELFRQALRQLSDPLLEHFGRYDLPEKEGFHCRLELSFRFEDGEQNGFAFHYGSDSQGPPQEINHFVAAAVEITEPWYARNRARAS